MTNFNLFSHLNEGKISKLMFALFYHELILIFLCFIINANKYLFFFKNYDECWKVITFCNLLINGLK